MITQNTKNILADTGTSRRRIGRYELLDCLATGGMAQVFLALSGELSGFRTLMVVKRILPHLSSNKHFIRMFFDEARLAALLDHPNIVRILEVGQDGDEYFLAMEAVQGRSLSSLLKRGLRRDRPLTHAQSAYIIAQAANGLGYAHNLTDANGCPLQVVHRDVSPQNILLSFDGTVKVIDFGVARALGRVTETRAGGIKGKVHYMSPEQAMGGEVDRRSDVFALGIVLWEALCGRRLFRRENERAALRAIVDEPIMAPSDVVRISPRLERIVMRALEKDPADRFKTAEEMALALERHAFTTEGFNPLQIGATMKELFASDHARWKKTIAAARQLEGPPEQWTNASGTYLRPQTIDLQTRGSTVVLQPEILPVVRSESTAEVHSDSASPSAEWSLPQAEPRRERHWLGGVGILLVAVALGAFAYSPALPTMNTVRAAAHRLPAAIIEPLTPRRAAPAAPEALTPPPEPPTLPAPATHATMVAPPPSPLEPAARAEEQQEQEEAEAEAPESEAPPAQPAAWAPKVALPPAAAAAPARPSLPPPSRAAYTKAAWPGRQKAAPPRPTRRPVVTASRPTPSRPVLFEPVKPGLCRMTLGTRPWTEIWIDGRQTEHHTPYTIDTTCGPHRLSFKRPDLGISRSYNITLYAGETFKESFTLAE